MIGITHIGLVIDSSEGPIFLISDVHAGSLQPSTDVHSRVLLEELLLIVAQTNGRIIILGDLFDYWQESGLRTPKPLHLWLDIFDRNKHVTKPIILITGNHDHWAGDALSNCGIVLVRDHILITTIDKPWLLLHGDGLPTNELKLTRHGLNKQFRKPFFNLLFNLLPLGVRTSIMKAFSNYRKQHDHDYASNQRIDLHMSNWLQSHDFIGLVYGHTHHKNIRYIDGKYLANTGTFFTDGTVMMIDGITPTMTTVDELKSTLSAKMTYIIPDGTR